VGFERQVPYESLHRRFLRKPRERFPAFMAKRVVEDRLDQEFPDAPRPGRTNQAPEVKQKVHLRGPSRRRRAGIRLAPSPGTFGQ